MNCIDLVKSRIAYIGDRVGSVDDHIIESDTTDEYTQYVFTQLIHMLCLSFIIETDAESDTAYVYMTIGGYRTHLVNVDYLDGDITEEGCKDIMNYAVSKILIGIGQMIAAYD